jgi:hypothetical protein
VKKTLQETTGKLSPSEAINICVEARYLALGMAMVGDGGSARLNARTQRLCAELVEWADEFTEMLDVALEWRELADKEKAGKELADQKRAEREGEARRRPRLTVVSAAAAS